MPNYSITLNFFIPKKIIKNLKKVKIKEQGMFDWRKENMCHCTLKAILISNKIPKKETIYKWISKSQKIFKEQKKFKIKIVGTSIFPHIFYANVHSSELIQLHKKLCKILPSNQPEFENKKYTPHVSIATITRKSKIKTKKGQEFGEFEVKQIQLMSWNLKNLRKPIIHQRFFLS